MAPNEVNALIKKLSPFLDEGSEVFRELAVFFGEGGKIDVHQDDLQKFLGRKRLFRVIRLKGESYKDCVYQLVDNYPERECSDTTGPPQARYTGNMWRPPKSPWGRN